MAELSLPLPQRLLVPLLERAAETRRRRGLLHDPHSVEIAERLRCPLAPGSSRLDRGPVRTRIFDEEVAVFLQHHPDGVIVELGCGLSTRSERLDNGTAHWVELDQPACMAHRRRLFAEKPRHTMLTGDLMSHGWQDAVADLGGPWCFVSEGALLCHRTEQIITLLRQLSHRFPGATLVMDTITGALAAQRCRPKVAEALPPDSLLPWFCDDPSALIALGAALVHTRTLMDLPDTALSRWVRRWAPLILRPQLSGYRINKFVLTDHVSNRREQLC